MLKILCCIAASLILSTAAAVTRTGQNSVKIPLSPGNVRISCPECTVPVPGPDKTVCNSGCDYTPSQLATTAISARVAGDVLEARTATPGGTEEWAANFVCSGTSGASGNPIVFRVRSGDHVRLSASGTLMAFSNCNYWVIDGALAAVTAIPSSFTAALTLGDSTEWGSGSPAANPSAAYTQSNTITCDTSNWIAFRGVSLVGAKNYFASELERTCNFVSFEGVYGQLQGSNNNPNTSQGAQWGDLIHSRARHIRFVNSKLALGGHNPLIAVGSYTVFRDSECTNDWTSKSTGNPSYRCIEFSPGNKDKWSDTSTAQSEFGPALMERALLHNVYDASGTEGPLTKLQGAGVILRDSLLYDSPIHPIQGPGYEDAHSGATHAGPAMRDIRVYHNTTYNTASVYRDDDASWAQPPLLDSNQEEIDFVNNVFQSVHTGTQSVQAFRAQRSRIALNGYANSWKGGKIAYNIFGGDSANMQVSLLGTGSATVSATDSSTWASNLNNNSNTSLSFVDAAARTFAGFALSASNPIGLGDAQYLTTVTATADSTHLTLAEPTYFRDGWGMTFADVLGNGFINEPADWIAVTPLSTDGVLAAVCTRIQSIDYSTGAVVVSPAISRAVGSKVWFGGNAESCVVHKNRGAVQ